MHPFYRLIIPTRPSTSVRTLSRLLLAPILLLPACQSDRLDLSGPDMTADASTWETIQSKILQPSCASQCHHEGTSFARQSDLILTADVAYEQLAGVEPHNDAARSDGIIRVRPESGTDASASYLWEKINVPEQDHFYADHPGYGSIMPLGGEPLTYGELEYVRQWLQAGAPETGEVADRNVLSNGSFSTMRHLYRQMVFSWSVSN